MNTDEGLLYIAFRRTRVSAIPRGSFDPESWSRREFVVPIFESKRMAERFADGGVVMAVDPTTFDVESKTDP